MTKTAKNEKEIFPSYLDNLQDIGAKVGHRFHKETGTLDKT